ncbi:MAG: efflux RND transporter periplasmic adaptor subunit [Chromatiales bacterium]|nr:efflux RND transporter periplasmic adaptor subunit [Chromatiales bacterium]
MNPRKLLPAIAVVVIAVLIGLGLRPGAVLIDSEPVSRGPLAVTIEEEGRTRVVDRFELSAPIAGQVRRVSLEVGDEIEAGQVLVRLDALPAPALDLRNIQESRARVAALEAALATAREEASAARASSRFAREEAGRLRRLGDDGLVPRNIVDQSASEAERAEAIERSARFRVSTAESELEAARAALAYAGGQDPAASGVFELTAPVSGRVLRRWFESARVVQAGEPLVEIGDPSALEVEVDVLSSDAVRIEPGMRVLFERWGAETPLEGRVMRVEPIGFTKVSALGVEEQRVWVIAEITSPREEWRRLGDGYRVNARFILWEEEETLRVPTSALFRDGERWALFTVEGGRARLNHVEPGRRGGLYTQLLSGLEAGQQVIVHPARDLADGARVR